MYNVITQLRSIGLKLTLIALLIACTGIFLSDVQAQSPSGQIVIPSIGVDVAIVPTYLSFDLGTWDVSELSMNVGHFEYLPWFGEGGNVVLGGHSTDVQQNPDAFYLLDSVSVGDEIIVYANNTEYRYQVTRLFEVNYDDISVLYRTEEHQLTLITCDVDSYDDNAGSYARRTIVVAHPM